MIDDDSVLMLAAGLTLCVFVVLALIDTLFGNRGRRKGDPK